MAKHDDEAEDKKLIKKALKMHDKGTSLSKLAKGGLTSEKVKAEGRNLARVSNQGGKKK